jgi:hypothetical protein
MLLLSTDKFLKNVYIGSNQGYIRFSDNYFDMVKERKYKVKISGGVRLRDVKRSLVFRTYIQIHEVGVELNVVYLEGS